MERLYDVKPQLEEIVLKLQELTARVKRDYTNSSKPSSMSPNHKKIPNSREKTERKPDGQSGHIHSPRKRKEPTRTMEIPVPEEYAHNDNYEPTGRLIRKQLIILYVDTEVVEYITPQFLNQTTGQRLHAAFPEGIKDDVNYDGSIKAFAYLLNNDCYVSIDIIRIFLEEMFGEKIELSNGKCGNIPGM